MADKPKIGIVSLGLIGGSILKALYKNYKVFCYSGTCPKEAFEYSENISDSLDVVKDCDIVFVCSPISKTLEILNALEDILKNDCIVADCASVKKDLLNKKFNYNFILSHPMAGREITGFDGAQADLFEGAKWLIEEENSLLIEIIKNMGAIPITFDMNKHDYSCAKISHLPMFLAYALFYNADNDSKKIASSGFRDMTRLASNPKMSVDMLEHNRENIDIALNEMIEKLNYLKNLPYDEKIKLFNNISLDRAMMYDKDGKNVFKS